MIMFVKTEFKGYDVKAMERFYKKQFRQAKKLGKTDEEAHELAKWMLEYYKHQFRVFA
jgi:hypothetical protein